MTPDAANNLMVITSIVMIAALSLVADQNETLKLRAYWLQVAFWLALIGAAMSFLIAHGRLML